MIGLASGFVATRRLALSPWLGVGLSLGAVSLASYGWLWLGAPGRLALFATEVGLLVAAWWLPQSVSLETSRASSLAPWQGPYRVPFALALVILVVGFGVGVARFPDGAWDAVDIWNVRARALARADLATALAGAKHPDYPLLLPLSVAYGWTWLGEGRAIPVALAALFALASAGLLHSATSARAGVSAARVVVILLIASPPFAVFAASQRADIPLGYLALGAVWLLVLAVDRKQARSLFLAPAGALLGCAFWMKNEGLLLAAAASIATWSVADRETRRALWRVAIGASPFAVALGIHKLTCGATTDLIAMQDASLGSRLLDPERYAQIGVAFLTRGAPYAAAALVAGWALGASRQTADPGASLLMRTLLLCLAGYAGVYLLTPHDLGWHLGSSLDRLLQQLWPIALLTLAYRLPQPMRAEVSKAS